VKQETSMKLRACLALTLTLMMEVTCFFLSSVDFQRATRRHIPEDIALATYYYGSQAVIAYFFIFYDNYVFGYSLV
jgi:hypothetical protein